MEADSIVGTRVMVYWNLHRKMYSIMDAATRRVIAHRNTLHLDGVTFKVSEAGRRRVLHEKRKNVHAFVCGTVVSPGSGGDYEGAAGLAAARYNPYRGSSFFTDDGVISAADHALLMGVERPTVYVLGAR